MLTDFRNDFPLQIYLSPMLQQVRCFRSMHRQVGIMDGNDSGGRCDEDLFDVL